MHESVGRIVEVLEFVDDHAEVGRLEVRDRHDVEQAVVQEGVPGAPESTAPYHAFLTNLLLRARICPPLWPFSR